MNNPYHLESTPSRVDFYTTTRLPLEPTGAMHTAREELRRALRLLRPMHGHELYASLTTQFHGAYDVENILFYNVGTANFRALSHHGLSFNLNPAIPQATRPYDYHHRYEVRPVQLNGSEAQLIFQLDTLKGKVRPHQIWWNARQGIRHGLPQSIERFRLRVTLEGYMTSPGLSVIAKPLLDGIIAAFHHQPGSLDPLTVARLAEALQVTHEQAACALADSTGTPLGPRKILSAYRDFIKWNPADELCVDCSIQWKPTNADKLRVAVRLEPAL